VWSHVPHGLRQHHGHSGKRGSARHSQHNVCINRCACAPNVISHVAVPLPRHCARTCKLHKHSLGKQGCSQLSAELVQCHRRKHACCRWVGTVLDTVEAGIMAASMLFAVGCFSRVLTTQGHDVELVMRGISSERGLAKLFSRLKGTQKGVRSACA
jgi:hypothetical protein